MKQNPENIRASGSPVPKERVFLLPGEHQLENERLDQLLRKRLSARRYGHSSRVADLAASLAARHGVSQDLAYLAGWFHDYARELPEEKLLYLARQKGMAVHPVDCLVPVLLHAPVGACLVKEEAGITEPEILNAIALHTIGGKNMTRLDKIIFLADMAEPGRDFPKAEEIRLLAHRDLNQAMIAAFKSAIGYVLAKETYVHPSALDGYNEVLAEINKCSLPAELSGRG
jgi:predicted HD superfamily hydrolase involved in NAD metabolism